MQATICVYREKLRHNLRFLSKIADDCGVIAVVKANAYGLGSVGVSRAIENEGKLSAFAVATIDEALELRNAGIRKPIIVLLPILPDRLNEAIENRITPTVHSVENLMEISEFSSNAGKIAEVHLKIDTGMNRWGIRTDELDRFIGLYKKINNVTIVGVYSHIFDKNGASFQIDRFDKAVEKLRENGINPQMVHILSSSSTMEKFRSKYGTDIRVGLALYGVDPFDLPSELEPAFEISSQILLIKNVKQGETVGYNGRWSAPSDTTVAIVPVGYEDGIMRSLSNKASVIINRHLAFIVGVVSMDAIAVNINGIDAKPYDRVTIIGKDGDKSVSVWELAKLAGTIPYEIMTGMGNRLERIYI